MIDLLERTHHEPLVPKRLRSVSDGPPPEGRTWSWRRRVAVVIAIAAAIVGLFAIVDDDAAGDEAPAPTVTTPAAMLLTR
jgi:hypothetical protein